MKTLPHLLNEVFTSRQSHDSSPYILMDLILKIFIYLTCTHLCKSLFEVMRIIMYNYFTVLVVILSVGQWK